MFFKYFSFLFFFFKFKSSPLSNPLSASLNPTVVVALYQIQPCILIHLINFLFFFSSYHFIVEDVNNSQFLSGSENLDQETEANLWLKHLLFYTM